MGTPQIFNYGKEAITFTDENGNVFVNATEMAKPFGKLPKDWLKTAPTKRFLEALEEHLIQKRDSQKDYNPFQNDENDDSDLNFFKMELVKVQHGGAYQGTWFHEDVALEFARWLSPAFAIWCNDRIKEILLGQAAKEAQRNTQPSFDEMMFQYFLDNFTFQMKVVTKEHAEYISRVRAEAGRKGGLRSGEVRKNNSNQTNLKL